MLYMRVNRDRRDCTYSVYNSRGHLALVTRNLQLAQSCADSFRDNPETTEVIVAAARASRPKRP